MDEPPVGTTVRDRNGWLWRRLDADDRGWHPVEEDGLPDPARDPESWTRVAGAGGAEVVCPTCGGRADDVVVYEPPPTRQQWLTLRRPPRQAFVVPCGHEVPVPNRVNNVMTQHN